MRTPVVFLLGTLVLLGGPAKADVFRSMAREFSRAALQERLVSVAVLPLVACDDSDPAYGHSLSERLITELVRGERIRVVERARLDNLLEEHRLDQSGVLSPSGEWRGKVLAVQALVVGSFSTAGPDVVFSARVVDAKTGMILAARSGRAPRADLAVENPGRAALRAVSAEPGLLDAIADTGSIADASCIETPWRIDQLESQVLELKARSWALRLHKGESFTAADDFPGAFITNTELRQTLYDRINAWYSEKNVPELRPDEQEHLRRAEYLARMLFYRCRM